jgi:hypothetical protein
MTACAVDTGESEHDWLTHTYMLSKCLSSGHEVSDPALRLPSLPIHQHQDNELSPCSCLFRDAVPHL